MDGRRMSERPFKGLLLGPSFKCLFLERLLSYRRPRTRAPSPSSLHLRLARPSSLPSLRPLPLPPLYATYAQPATDVLTVTRFLVARGVCTTSHDFSHIAVMFSTKVDLARC